MDYIIREIKEEEIKLLDRFLYLAIYVHKGEVPPPFDIIYKPELQVYVENLGKERDDHILVAESEGIIVGAVWVRIMDDYGHVDDETPSFAISLYKDYRGKGIGTKLMEEMLDTLREQGYKRASLAVQKANYAVKMYQKTGFKIIDESDEEFIMVCEL